MVTVHNKGAYILALGIDLGLAVSGSIQALQIQMHRYGTRHAGLVGIYIWCVHGPGLVLHDIITGLAFFFNAKKRMVFGKPAL